MRTPTNSAPATNLPRRIATPLLMVALAVYSAFIAYGLAHHPLWGDETEIWQAVTYLSPWELLTGGYTNTSGHPALWHLLVMPLAKAGLPVEFMQALNGVIAIAMAGVFLRFAPFPTLTKLLWLFSLPVAYEFAVISRNYGIISLVLFTLATLYPTRFTHPLRYALALFLLLQTHALMFATGTALAGAYGFELWRMHRTRAEGLPRRQLAGLLLMALGVALALWQLWPPEGTMIKPKKGGHPIGGMVNIHNVKNAAQEIAFSPFAQPFSNPNPLFKLDKIFILAALFTAMAFTLLQRRLLAGVFGLTLGWFLYVGGFKYNITYRHYAQIPEVMLFCLWLAHHDGASLRPAMHWKGRTLHFNAVLLLTLSFFYNCLLTPVYYATTGDFSGSQATIAFLRKHHLENRPIVMHHTYSLLPHLPRGCCWSPPLHEDETYINWDISYWSSLFMQDEEGLDLAQQHFGNLAGKVFIFDRKLKQCAGLTLIYHAEGTSNLSENQWVYIPDSDVKTLPMGN